MKTALYPGTFDPITFGHLDLIERAVRIFDRLVVAVGHNPQKQPLFSVAERMDMIREVTAAIPQVEVASFADLTVHYARSRGIYTIIRSLRTSTEYEWELATAVANRQLEPKFESVYLMPSVEYSYLSSTIVREIAQFGGDLTPFVPPPIARKLQSRFSVPKAATQGLPEKTR